jgi:hypothetical protein
MAQRAVAARFFRAFKVEQPAFFKVNEDRLGGTTEQAGGQNLKMGVMPDYQHGLSRAGQAQGHRPGIVLGLQSRSFHERGVELEFFLENFGGLNGAHQRAVPDLPDLELDLVFAQEIGEVLDLFFPLASQAPGGVGLARFSVRMSQQV